MCCGARSAPRLPHALSALWLLARLLPEGQAAVRALRVSPGLPGHSEYSTLDCQDLLGCLHKNVWLQSFQQNKPRPTSAPAGYNALAVRRHFPGVYAAPLEVSRPPCIHMIDMLVNGIIRSVSAGVVPQPRDGGVHIRDDRIRHKGGMHFGVETHRLDLGGTEQIIGQAQV